MKIYFVENIGNAPGRVTAVFASEEDAGMFRDQLEEADGDAYDVVERTLWYGQPDRLGYNE